MANYDLTYEGSRVQNILDTGDELRDAGYIFRGEATPSTVPGTPTERVAYIGGPGTYTNFGSSITVGAGCICVFKYTGSAWSNQVINTGLSAAISAEAESRANADGQLQNAINAINAQIGNGYLYAGVATPSTSPVTGKVFYLAITAGTYTNFEDSEETPLAVTAGINILKNTGTGWVLDQVIAIDAEPTQGSDNLVKSGGVLNSIIQNGPAFDLSAYNAQEGVLATYADLSAALTALNALPADFKKGGMSMKFVLSSDNKYVQYRLIPSEFTAAQFANPANWQGVVEVPTTKSKDLVQSNGVAKAIELNSLILGNILDFSNGSAVTVEEVSDRGRVNQNGVIVDASGSSLLRFRIDGNKIYKFYLPRAGDYASPFAIADANNNIDFYWPADDRVFNKVLAFPNVDGYILLSVKSNQLSNYSVTAIDITGDILLNIKDGSIPLSKLASGTIDSTPTENSDNLVKSGGVFSAIATVSSTLSNSITSVLTKTNTVENEFIGFVEKNCNHDDFTLAANSDGLRNKNVTAIVSAGNYYMVKVTPKANGTLNSLRFRTTDNSYIVWLINQDGYVLTQNSPLYFIVKLTQLPEFLSSNKSTVDLDVQLYNYSLLVETDITNIKTVIGSNFTDVTPELTWTDGKRLQYYSDTDIRISNHTGNRVSNAVALQKGDIVVIDKGTASDIDSVSFCRCDSDGNYRTFVVLTRNMTNYRYIAPDNCYVRFCINDGNTINIYRMIVENDIQDLEFSHQTTFPMEEILPLVQNLATPETYHTTVETKNLVLLHFSDIHGQQMNMERILKFKDVCSKRKGLNDNYAIRYYVDDILSTGDICPSKYYDYVSTFEDLTGYNKVLQVIGNHDVYDHNGDGNPYDDPQYYATPQEKYERYMKYISQWGVTQPTGAGEDGYYPCYYYKDYTDEKVRLIVLDAMAYDATQHSWLVSTLESARTSSLHVVCTDHFVPTQGAAEVAAEDYLGFNTPFNSLENDMASPYGKNKLSYMNGENRVYATDVVDTFIANGGYFVCWLAGHMHYDLVGKIASHPNQMYIAVASAKVDEVMRHDARDVRLSSVDCFNLVGIDTYSKHIKVVRIGAQWDRWVRKRETMLLDYKNRTLLYTT